MTERAMQKTEEQAAARVQSPLTETIYSPDVDICDRGEEVVLTVSMPGVERDAAQVTVENGVLRIEGRGAVDVPSGYRLIGQEYEIGRYRREFQLSNAVAPESVKARMSQGVLTVSLAKREELRRRKIEIAG